MSFQTIDRNNVIIERKLAHSSFADIFAALDFSISQPLAIKVACHPSSPSTIEAETTILRSLSSVNGIPKVLWTGQINNRSAFMMPLLGPSLADQIGWGQLLSLHDVSALALELLTILEGVHSKGILHLDLKPSNILFSPNSHQIYLIDFNISKSYLSTLGEHLPLSQIGEFNGNVQFASINAHQFLEQSRRDELESLGYLLLSLCYGGLEWNNENEADFNKKIIYVGEEKKKFLKTVENNATVPKFLRRYFSMINEIGFYDKPNYNRIRQLFSEFMASKQKEEHYLEWKMLSESKRTLGGSSKTCSESIEAEKTQYKSNLIKKKGDRCFVNECDYGNYLFSFKIFKLIFIVLDFNTMDEIADLRKTTTL